MAKKVPLHLTVGGSSLTQLFSCETKMTETLFLPREKEDLDGKISDYQNLVQKITYNLKIEIEKA